MGFDLSIIESRKNHEAGVFFPILHPKTGEPLIGDDGKEVRIKIGGADAARIKSAVEEREAARKKELADAMAPADPTKPTVPTNYDTWQWREKDAVDDIVILTEGWTDNMVLDGEPLPFSKENARKLYQRFPEIVIQMTARATNRLNFLPTSASG